MLQMPSGIYPEVAFPRIVVIAQTPGLAVKDVEIAVTRPIEEAVSIVLGVIRVRSKSVRGAAELSIDFAPDTDMIQALNDVRAPDGRGRRPACRPALPRSSSGRRPRSSRSSRSSSPADAIRRRCTTTLTTTCGRGSAASPDVSYVTVQGGDIREILVEVDPQALVAAGLSHRRRGRSTEQGASAQGRRATRSRDARNTRCWPTRQARDPLDLEDRVIAEKNGQWIRLRDLGRVTIVA